MNMDEPGQTSAPRPVVLMVDDEHQLLETMRLGLAGEFDLDLAATAEEAELMMATRRYDIVVSDHLMPGEVGLDFLIRARARHPGTKRILITGYMNPELIMRSVNVAELSACLVKPVRAAKVAEAIRAALAK
ncbi:MAG TPA: response regulator [Opitutus sp.]|nr:response regulator [Opitutus sp.]